MVHFREQRYQQKYCNDQISDSHRPGARRRQPLTKWFKPGEFASFDLKAHGFSALLFLMGTQNCLNVS